MPDDRNDDDSYILEDSGETIADIEHEMEVAAQEADDTLTHRKTAPGGVSAAIPTDNEDLRKLNDRYLRTVAAFENLLRDLLPVLDNFDRSLDHAAEGDDFHKGVLLIYKQLYDFLQRNGLKPIEEVGVRFDPNIHEAVIRE